MYKIVRLVFLCIDLFNFVVILLGYLIIEENEVEVGMFNLSLARKRDVDWVCVVFVVGLGKNLNVLGF